MNNLLFRAATTAAIWMLAVASAIGGEKPLAFPEAEGFGALAQGGRGDAVLLVTNLEDYLPGREQPLPGSLRAACDAEGPRIVVFRASGVIPLKTTLTIANPYITIAGQSAPGGGVCLKDYGVSIRTHDVILRHVRERPGDELGPVYKNTPTTARAVRVRERTARAAFCSIFATMSFMTRTAIPLRIPYG